MVSCSVLMNTKDAKAHEGHEDSGKAVPSCPSGSFRVLRVLRFSRAIIVVRLGTYRFAEPSPDDTFPPMPPDISHTRRRIDDDPVLRAVRDAMRARMEPDAAHDEAHLVRVAAWTVHLLAAEPGGDAVDPRLAIAAALLHDVVNVPKHVAGRFTASEASAAVVREVLPSLGFTPAQVDAAADAVRDHSFSRGAVPATPLGRALQDADRLEAVGALGIYRCLTTGVRFGAGLADPDDPWAEQRSLAETRWSVDHFFTKLLRLPPTLLTAAGRAEADRRVQVMHAFLAQLGEELQVPYRG